MILFEGDRFELSFLSYLLANSQLIVLLAEMYFNLSTNTTQLLPATKIERQCRTCCRLEPRHQKAGPLIISLRTAISPVAYVSIFTYSIIRIYRFE